MTKRKKPTPQDDFIIRLVLLKDEAARLGLFRTMHALDIPATVVGWEIAGESIPEYSKKQFREMFE